MQNHDRELDRNLDRKLDAMQNHSVTSGSSPVDKAQHTPGPWTVVSVGYNSHSYYIRACNRPEGYKGQFPYSVARIPNSTIAPMEANARLIAAAPDLLAALELLYDHCRLYHREVETNNVGEAVRAAFSKAKGKP